MCDYDAGVHIGEVLLLLTLLVPPGAADCRQRQCGANQASAAAASDSRKNVSLSERRNSEEA